MYADTALLDRGVDTGKIDVERSCQGYRAKRTVRRKRNVIRFGHGRNPHHLRNTARMAEVGLDDIQMAIMQQVLEIPTGKHPLARGDGNAAVSGNMSQRLSVQIGRAHV